VLIGDVAEQREYALYLAEVLSVGPVMMLPLVASQRVRGVLTVGRLHGRHRFTEADLDIATTFANHAAVALELADGRAQLQRMALLEDRDRIARDLHDHVIQRLFAAGLTVQSVAAAPAGPGQPERLGRVVSDLDDTIRQIRTSIFQLRGPLGPQTASARGLVLDVVAEVTESLGFAPEVRFTGPIDTMAAEDVVDDVVAVLRESLTNVARHAQASHVDVELAVTTTQLILDVADNGSGIGQTARRSGLANLHNRAEQRGGSLTVTAPDGKGTRLRWTIPLT